jgi:hypothetical protein
LTQRMQANASTSLSARINKSQRRSDVVPAFDGSLELDSARLLMSSGLGEEDMRKSVLGEMSRDLRCAGERIEGARHCRDVLTQHRSVTDRDLRTLPRSLWIAATEVFVPRLQATSRRIAKPRRSAHPFRHM